MLPLLQNLLFLIIELLRVPFDLVVGTKRRIYEVSRFVDAPKTVAWNVVSAHKIKLEGPPPMELDTEPDPARPGVFTGTCQYNDKRLKFAYQILAETPGEAMTLRLLADECDPIYQVGDDYIGAVAVAGDDRQSVITECCELTHTRISTRLLMPLTVLRSLYSLKRTAEARAGRHGRNFGDQLTSAAITGALTFASFSALFDMSTAVILLLVVLLHELGHVLAMRWVGIPVRGIYFIPFFGGVAVGEGFGKSEAVRGFVALMGPAGSMLTTGIFFWLSLQNDDPFLADLVLLSAVVNGLNLLPILPLDGGRILQALTSRLSPRGARAIHGALLLVGVGLAAWFGDYLLMALILLIAPGVLSKQTYALNQVMPLTRREMAWLVCGYGATLLFYIGVAERTWNTPLVAGGS
ncbi:site-2 protease family protein [Hyphomicrobium sp. B1]|uniref:metalloprotease n=1 Tax=Hyphomicrobium sp. B1 TaxID=3075651 RepID=UPI003C2D433C